MILPHVTFEVYLKLALNVNCLMTINSDSFDFEIIALPKKTLKLLCQYSFEIPPLASECKMTDEN